MVVMMLRRVRPVDLIAAAAVAELHLLQDAELREQLEAAVDRGEANLGFVVAQDAVYILSRKVLARMVEEDLEDDLALRRHLVLALLQHALEVVHRESL